MTTTFFFVKYFSIVLIVIFSEFRVCRVFFSRMINYIAEIGKRGKRRENMFYSVFSVIVIRTLDFTCDVL